MQAIKRWFFRKSTARQTWEQARDRYLAAKRRGDTRGQHDAWEALREATTAKLRARA